GTTTFADMYFHLEEEARAVEETGIRAVLSRGLIGLEEQAQKNLEEAVTQAREWRGRAGNRITVMLGPHAPYTCPPAFLKEVVAAAKQYNLGIHIHLAETADELVEIGKEYGKRPVAYLAEQGIFTRPVLAAHAVWLDDGEISYLGRQKVAIAHNPSSNMKLASGIAPVPKLLAAKIPVGLGTDGAASNNRLDIFEEMRTAALLHKVQTSDPTVVPAETAIKMATLYGARALGLGDVTGSLEPGKSADLIMLDLNKSHLTPLHDPVSLVVYAARGSDVSDVMVNGEWLVRDGRLVRWDEEEVIGEATRCVQSLVKK
ncbi:MAG: amidohydrolase, partial [Clostridia bacterium]|nr:amidohydrolase [Clostridia bacterium]